MIKTRQQIETEIANKPNAEQDAAEAAVRFITEQMINDQLYDAVLNDKNADIKIDFADPQLAAFTVLLDQITKDEILSDHSDDLKDSGWAVGKVDAGSITVSPIAAEADPIVADGGGVEIKP